MQILKSNILVVDVKVLLSMIRTKNKEELLKKKLQTSKIV